MESVLKMKTHSYKDIIVWQKSFALVKTICQLAHLFPKEEVYGLCQQIRRASVAIPSNIAEGYGRQHPKEYAQFLSIAYGSLCELETQYLLSQSLGYHLGNVNTEGLIQEVSKMLYCMLRK
jgi:four helix bundle protein